MSEIRAISKDEAIAIRWPILRPQLPRKEAVFDGDSASTTRHFGAIENEQFVGAASIYASPFVGRESETAFQLRGMATFPKVRGHGHGRALLTACESAARDAGAKLIWCNARIEAAPFYEKHGWQIIGEPFDIPTVGTHYRMWRAL